MPIAAKAIHAGRGRVIVGSRTGVLTGVGGVSPSTTAYEPPVIFCSVIVELTYSAVGEKKTPGNFSYTY